MARRRPDLWSRAALGAPTWRGPLRTMIRGYRPIQQRIAKTLRAPLVGPLLYRLNVADPVVAAMHRRHVFSDPVRVTAAFVASKAAIARRPGYRFGSAAFVSGALDIVQERESLLAMASPPAAPIFVVYGDSTPPRSRTEIDGLVALSGIRSERFMNGALGIHEEFPVAVGASLLTFLLGR